MKDFFASCPRGMEEMLLEEAKPFVQEVELGKGGILFKADWRSVFVFIITTRLASRVFLKLHEFKFKNEKDVPAHVESFDWQDFIDSRDTLKIQTILDRDGKKIYKNSVYMSQLVKDGIVDKIKAKRGTRPSVELDNPTHSFNFRVEGDYQCFRGIISVDLCGEALSNRGYRPPGHKAPLRENLAAAILMASDWNPKEDVLVDGMCGSGTFLAEAALMLADVTPAYLRLKKTDSFSFEKHPWFKNDPALSKWWFELKEKVLIESQRKLSNFPQDRIYGFDNHRTAMHVSRETLKFLGLGKDFIPLELADVTELAPPQESGVFICNPPYGERLGDFDELGSLYYKIGENLKNNFKGYRGYVFTGNPELRKKIALQTSARVPFWNGKIECRLLRYELR
jgi:23S rRNA G2445 N2-methylase RlmL